jgi:hypothetical protein
MSYNEYSIIYFDDCVINQSPNRNVIQAVESLLKAHDIPIVYSLKIRMTGVDCFNTIEFLQKALVQRKIEYKHRTQILLIIYDHPFVGESVKLITSAKNVAFFTRDLNNWSPNNEHISFNIEKFVIKYSPFMNIKGIECFGSNSLYLDNYIYFLALLYSENIPCYPLLFHVPAQVTSEDLVCAIRKIDNKLNEV